MTAMSIAVWPQEWKEESSFSEEKEAKRLSPSGPGGKGKISWFFFSRKNRSLAYCAGTSAPTCAEIQS
jgi:hypothetical protein